MVSMMQKIKNFLRRLSKGPLGPLMCAVWDGFVWIEIQVCNLYFRLKGVPRPTGEQQEFMRKNVTFVYKSFERQHLARRLYRNIQKYYPGVRVIIADDSRKPLQLSGPGLQIVQLPFNVGLSAGLNRALALVETPFVIRMDDDELLSPCTNFHLQLEFLLSHPEVDLVGVLPMTLPYSKGWKNKGIERYRLVDMSHAEKPLKIPHNTRIDQDHIVLGKVPNIFIARTDEYRKIGYDDHIRMIDHQEFFFRAAGNLVSVLACNCFIFHNHCPFHYAYQVYRADCMGDRRYIAMKYAILHHSPKNNTSADET